MTHYFEKLSASVLAASVEKTIWSVAVLEWKLVNTTHSADDVRCECGTPITMLHRIRNRHSGADLIVGSVCIDRFMQDNVPLIEDAIAGRFAAVRRPCLVCGKLTRHKEACARCVPMLNQRRADDARRLAVRAAAIAPAAVIAPSPRLAARALSAAEIAAANAQTIAAAAANRYAAEDAALEAKWAKGQRAWEILNARLDSSRMTDLEREFVYNTIQYRVRSGEPLTTGQRAWLLQIAAAQGQK